jgi:hypothetical protein
MARRRLSRRAHGYGFDMGDERQAPDEPPHDSELDVEAPNESAPGHNPPEQPDDADE